MTTTTKLLLFARMSKIPLFLVLSNILVPAIIIVLTTINAIGVVDAVIQHGSVISNGTFAYVRKAGSTCTPLTVSLVAVEESATSTTTAAADNNPLCMQVPVQDIVEHVLAAPMIRYVPVLDDENNENTSGGGYTEDQVIEMGIGAVKGLGTFNGYNFTYVCPPDGYNGFSKSQGSFCETSPDVQLWAIFTQHTTGLIQEIRIILANEFPNVSSLQPHEPPFGTAIIDFRDSNLNGGLNLTHLYNVSDDTGDTPTSIFLAFCPTEDASSSSSSLSCPITTLPPTVDLDVALTSQSYGYFGSDLLPTGAVIPGYWNQNDELQMVSGITSPSSIPGGLQDFYFNEDGFYVHMYDAPNNASPDRCYFFDYCNYQCEVYNFDSRFFDFLGAWDVVWKYESEYFDLPPGEEYSLQNPRRVLAFMGNAIDAAGIFPTIQYQNVDKTAYLGLDKIGSALLQKQPGYAYYWYTNYTVGPPPMDVLTTPDICQNVTTSTGKNEKSTTLTPPTSGGTTNSTSSSAASLSSLQIGMKLILSILAATVFDFGMENLQTL